MDATCTTCNAERGGGGATNNKVSPEHPRLTSRILPIPKSLPIFEASGHIKERGSYPSASQDSGVKMKTGVHSLCSSEHAVVNRKLQRRRMSELEDGNKNKNKNLTIGATQTRGRGYKREWICFAIDNGAMEDTVSPEYPRSTRKLLPNPTTHTNLSTRRTH